MTSPSSFGRLLWALWAVMLLGIAGAWGWTWLRQQRPAPVELPVYGTVGDLELTERSGQPFALRDLAGRVWILNFFFSSCTDVCPRTLPQMERLQSALAAWDDARLVSITVDPEHDTPAVLAEVAQNFHAQPGRWYFLTGDQRAIYGLSLNTFRMAVEALPISLPPERGDAFQHDAHFVLMDQRAQIRGYYDGLDDEAVARLRQDAQALLHQ